MKRRKKKVDSFKNWLLARDSSSRISTYPKYHSFLESSSPIKRNRSEVMNVLESIKEGKEFYKLSSIINYGLAIDAYDGCITIWMDPRDARVDIRKFTESLNFKFPRTYIRIILDDNIEETKIEYGTDLPNEDGNSIKMLIPSSFDDRKIVQESKKCLRAWYEKCYPGSEPVGKFFSWWMENYLYKQEKYSNFLKSFESAVVEWMRTCEIGDAGKIYMDLLINSDDPSIKRISTEIGNREIVDHINMGIKEFNIPIGDLVRGASVIKRFGII